MTQLKIESDPYHIEDFAPLRDSVLWELQRNYFKSQGLAAWEKEVPFYISSNAFIAERYAQLVHSTIQDVLILNPALKSEKFYIMELGAGVGKFSFYFLKSFFEILGVASDLNITYIMTDVVEKNKDFWQKNAYFQELTAKGQLEFLLLDMESTPPNINTKTPLIIIANYVFDCIKQDAFQIRDNELNEIQFQIKSRYKNYDQAKAKHLKEIQFEFFKQPVKAPYSDSISNKILEDYQSQLPDQSVFTFPLAAIEFLNKISKATDNNYILIAGDKGLSQMQSWAQLPEKDLFSYDGCYSFMFNFEALGRYIKAKGGDCLLTKNSNAFKISLYASHYSFSELKGTAQRFNQDFESFSADEFCYLNEEIQRLSYGFSFKAIMAYLRLSQWDMDVYQSLHDRFIELIPIINLDFYPDILSDIKRVENNIYYYPGAPNIYNQLGIFYQAIGQTDKAIEFYEKALVVFGETVEPHHNLGLLYDKMGNSDLAILHYEKSDDDYAKRRIARLSGNFMLGFWKVLLKILFVFGLTALVLYYLTFVL